MSAVTVNANLLPYHSSTRNHMGGCSRDTRGSADLPRCCRGAVSPSTISNFLHTHTAPGKSVVRTSRRRRAQHVHIRVHVGPTHTEMHYVRKLSARAPAQFPYETTTCENVSYDEFIRAFQNATSRVHSRTVLLHSTYDRAAR